LAWYAIHVWGCFSRNGVGILKRIRDNMNSTVYQDILTNEIDLIGKFLVFPQRSFIFQQDNAPYHRSDSTLGPLNEEEMSSEIFFVNIMILWYCDIFSLLYLRKTLFFLWVRTDFSDRLYKIIS